MTDGYKGHGLTQKPTQKLMKKMNIEDTHYL